MFVWVFVAAAYIGRGKVEAIPVYKRFINLRDSNYTFKKTLSVLSLVSQLPIHFEMMYRKIE